MKTTRGVTLALLIAAVTIGATRVGGAEQTAHGDVLLALLSEVRGLRAAMEQAASVTPAIQLGLGRLQIHEQRIINHVRRLDEVRAQIAVAQSDVDRCEQQLHAIAEAMRSDGSAVGSIEERHSFEAAVKGVKAEQALGRTAVQRLKDHEAQLLQDLASDEGRWTELNQRLERLERELTSRR